jgi:hypothetical protein
MGFVDKNKLHAWEDSALVTLEEQGLVELEYLILDTSYSSKMVLYLIDKVKTIKL